MPSTTPPAAPRSMILAAFAAVYVIWGSTYLAIKFGIESLPPFLMAGTRFLVAGALLYGWVRRDGPPRTTRSQWGWAFVVGGLLLFGGNGAVVWASYRVPSGVISLLVAATPIWMVLLDWLRPGGRRPGALVGAGLLLGTVGLALLVGARGGTISERLDPLGAAVVLFGSLCWSCGSLASRSTRLPASPLLSTAMQMLAGGALMIAAGLASGEAAALDLDAVSLRSWLAWAYLVTFGSLIGYTAYIWLLSNVSAAKVATYAYVNPIVAVGLGWALAGEALSHGTVVAAVVIVGAVALITAGQSGGEAHAPRAVVPSAPAATRRRSA